MENTKKVGFLFLILLILSCTHNIKNVKYLKKEKGELFFKHRTFSPSCSQKGSFIKGDSVFYENVLYDNKLVKNKKIIDEATFDLLSNDMNDRKKIKNDYYLKSGNDYYFKDKNYIYIYRDDFTIPTNTPIFFIAGKTNNYEVLGGGFLKVGNEIYNKGYQIKNVNIETFKTGRMILKNSEWFITIGIDKNGFYFDNSRIDKSELPKYKNKILGINTDSLQAVYLK